LDYTPQLWAVGPRGPILQGHSGRVFGALRLADGRVLSWGEDTTARPWAADGAPGPVLEGPTGPVTGTVQLADGRLHKRSSDITARLWAADGAPGPVLCGGLDAHFDRAY
jgi:hypothetical protein